ncbi:MAG TPA: cytochrome c oxidase assembly factor Coa1 family protein [Blastocatellia bacterium]|nr:cytochrome c oxidase assembly factor Coa1 family protein [Blastocatellia bacterium]
MTTVPEKRGWFGRNWKWLIPVGCLGIIVLIVAFVAAIIMFVFGAIKSSDVYQQALTKAKSNPAVTRELGEPIEPGWLVSGSINVNNGSGDANLSIPVSGPKKGGTVYALATKKQGRWEFSTLEVEVDGQGRRINLLAPSTE